MPSDNSRIPVTYIDPAMARRMLAHNTRNRPVSPYMVARYASDMKNGRWVYAADPIRFATDGTLIDGQHRLIALASLGDDQGISLPFLIIRGLPLESQLVMDQGRKRDAGQQLALVGVKHYSTVASGVKLHLILESGFLFRDRKTQESVASTAAIQKWVSAHPALVEDLSRFIQDIKSCDAPPSVGYAAAISFFHLSPERCTEFFRLLRAGAGEGHPINTLDKRLQRDRRAGTRVSQRDHLGMFFQAWNMWLEGRSITALRRPGGAYTVETFPKLVAA